MRAIRAGAVALAVAAPATLAAVAAAGLRGTPAAAAAQAGGPAPVQVTANGDIFGQLVNPNDLNFAPASVTASVGQVVRWTNTDAVVPHTVTENHNLFDLAGNYGGTPLNPSGFAPGTAVQRVFAAGTYLYYCRVHPMQMHGAVAVPVTLAVEPVHALTTAASSARKRGHRKHHKRPRKHHKPAVPRRSSSIVASWAAQAPAGGQVFDVRYRAGGGPWLVLATGTTALGTKFAGGAPGTVWHVEARLRAAANPGAASDWSPDATITST